MKKILILTNHSYMLYRFRLELIQALAKEHEVVLSMPFVGHEEDFKALGIRCIETAVDRRGINPKTDFKLLRTYKKLLKTERPDLVITYSVKPNIYAGLACKKMGIPYFANVQGLGTAFQRKGIAQLVTFLYKRAFKKVRKVFFENQANAAEFRSRNILSAEKQVVLNGAGINLDTYHYTAYPQNDVPHFLYLGRIMKEKGMDELLAASKRLREEGLSFHLDFVGFFEDAYKEQIEALVQDGIATYHGFQENPIPYYEATDCVVLPSYHEGLSNVLLEAAAIGRPVITSDIPGCREAVDADRSGLLAEARNTDALYEAMKRLLAMSAQERAQMGVAGREKMQREFRKELVVSETLKALNL